MSYLPQTLLALIFLHTATFSSLMTMAHELSSTYTLSSEITAIIPSCAQTCFESFVRANFPISVCTSSPTLDCICSHSSLSGFTVGEGALQCIISEQNIGFCQGQEAQQGLATVAYNMCTGRTNALPNTHPTITATLVLQTSNPSVVLVAPTTTPTKSSTSRAATLSSSKTTTAISSRNSGAENSQTSSLRTDTGLSPTVGNSIGVTSTPEASETGASPVTRLSTQQISAITAGSVGGAALLMGLLFLCFCIRKRRRRILDYNSDSSSFATKIPQNNGKGRTWSSGFGKSLNGPPRPKREMTGDPNIFARSSQLPVLPTIRTVSPNSNAIGVAMSPEARYPSRLLPPKPVLTLRTSVSANQEKSGTNQNFSVPVNMNAGSNLERAGSRYQRERESNMTQFEEDPEDSYPYSPDDIGCPAQHRRMGSTEPILPILLPSRSQAQVPTKNKPLVNANWQPQIPPRSFTGPADLRVRPLIIRKSQQINLKPPMNPGFLQVQTSATRQDQRPTTAASSIYSQPGIEQINPISLLPSQIPRLPDFGPGWRPQLPGQPQGKKPIYGQNQYQNQNQNQGYQPYRATRPEAPRRKSSDSVTSIESQAAPPRPASPPRTPKIRTENLTPNDSPVGKSPKGVSPVTYPDPNSFGHPAYRRNPAPPQPIFVIPQPDDEKPKYRGPPVITGTMSTQMRKSRANLQVRTQLSPPPMPQQVLPPQQQSRRTENSPSGENGMLPAKPPAQPGLGLRLHNGDLDSRYGNEKGSGPKAGANRIQTMAQDDDGVRVPLGDVTGYVQTMSHNRMLEPGERSAIELTPQKKGEQMFFTVA